jgi:hypothetical protein
MQVWAIELPSTANDTKSYPLLDDFLLPSILVALRFRGDASMVDTILKQEVIGLVKGTFKLFYSD